MKPLNRLEAVLRLRRVGAAALLGWAGLALAAPAASAGTESPSVPVAEGADDGTDCTASDSIAPGAYGGAWYHTVTPTEQHDSARSQLYAGACSLHQSGRADGLLAIQARAAPGAYPNAYNIATRQAGELFIYGGYAGLGGAYVAKLDPSTLQEIWRSTMTTPTGQWSYLGAMGVLGNGSVYSIQNNLFARIDPASGAVQRLVLPQLSPPQGSGAAYNGFLANPDGLVFAKSIERGPCDRDTTGGLNCVIENKLPSRLVVIDPEAMAVLTQLEISEPSLGRIMTERHDGIDYIYVPGLSQLRRYQYVGGVLSLDTGWGPFDYDGGANAGGVGLMGDYAVTQTNYLPSMQASRLIAVNIRDGRRFVATPFAAPGDMLRPSWVPSKAATDAENQRIYAEDTYAGQIAAVTLSDAGFHVDWKRRNISKGFFALTGPRAARQLIVPMRQKNGDAVAWRDANTGTLRQVSVPLAEPSTLSVIAPGFQSRVYYPSFGSGQLIELVPELREETR
jgi:hypothetical protein